MTRRVGLLGGSFNPAHRGHRRVTLAAIRALDLDEAWWLVSPGNPLKAGAPDMAPLAARLASARATTRRAPIRATAVEARLGTRYTADTAHKLVEEANLFIDASHKAHAKWQATQQTPALAK